MSRVSSSGDEPSSHPLYALFTLSPTAPVFQGYLHLLAEDRRETDSPEIKQFRDCEYWNYRNYGVSFCFDRPATGSVPQKLALGTAHIYNNPPDQGYQRFRHCLPHGIRVEMTGREVVGLLGEPSRKGGGSTGGSGPGVWFAYDDKGLQFDLAAQNWDRAEESVVGSIAVYFPEVDHSSRK